MPRDAVVEFEDPHTGWKDTRYRTRRSSRPGWQRIRISGIIGFGRLKIRHTRRRDPVREQDSPSEDRGGAYGTSPDGGHTDGTLAHGPPSLQPSAPYACA